MKSDINGYISTFSFLISKEETEDKITEAKQKSWKIDSKEHNINHIFYNKK